MYKDRFMTNLVDTAPKDARERFPKLLTIEHEGMFTIEHPFAAAVEDAERETENYFATNHARASNQRN
eukprot:2427138-Prymnesium_polylepis.1